MNLEKSQNCEDSSHPENGELPAEFSSINDDALTKTFSEENVAHCSRGAIDSNRSLPLLSPKTDGNEAFSCSVCPLKNCPTRGIMEEKLGEISAAEKACLLSPAQMVLASGFVFIFPLICAVAGIYGMNAIRIAEIPEDIRPVLGAIVGFFSGLLLVQSVLTFKRFWNGQ